MQSAEKANTCFDVSSVCRLQINLARLNPEEKSEMDDKELPDCTEMYRTGEGSLCMSSEICSGLALFMLSPECCVLALGHGLASTRFLAVIRRREMLSR